MWANLRTQASEAWRVVSIGLSGPRTRPGDLVRSAMARIRVTLNAARSISNPRSGATLDKVRTDLRRITDQVFDLEHMARGALWQHWSRRTPSERRHFVALFTELLERLYVAHLRQSRWATMLPVGEMVQGTFATVTWNISAFDQAVVLDYRLHCRKGQWKIYDVMLNGSSFVASCRADFDQAIHASSYAALVRDMPRRDRAGFFGVGHTLTPAASLASAVSQ
jgi:phospholipid transport system substrate-binding protein